MKTRLPGATLLLVISAAASLVLLGRQQTAAGPSDLELALFHAPILYQDTEVQGRDQDPGNPAAVDQPIQRRGDFITRVDFDGDYNGLNNWENFARPVGSNPQDDTLARAFGYYSVVETATHYYIGYYFFHPHDREPICSDSACHENDLEGGIHMVRKGTENGGMGTLWLTSYLAHDYWFTYLTPEGKAAGIRKGGRPPHQTAELAHHYNAGFLYDVVWRGTTSEGQLLAPAQETQAASAIDASGAVLRPAIWSEPFGHGLYGWPGETAQSPYDRYRREGLPWRDGFLNGDGVIYVPGRRAATPDPRKAVDIVSYELIDIFAPGGLWDRREDIDRNGDGCRTGPVAPRDCLYGYYGTFRGERWGTDKANSPWRWDHNDDQLPPGLHALDPLRLIEEFNDLSAVPAGELARDYSHNRFRGIPRGTRPARPLPVADAGPDRVVRPGQLFRLDGSRSRTGDLEGSGHLQYSWSCADAGWEAPAGLWMQEAPQLALSREGFYRVTLTVHDGDHGAADEVNVWVTSRLIFADDFQSPQPAPAWRFTAGTWRQEGGLLRFLRPGQNINAAYVDLPGLPQGMEVRARVRLEMMYPEARVPFGLALGLRPAPGTVDGGVGFGFSGTRRTEQTASPDATHVSRLRFVMFGAADPPSEPFVYRRPGTGGEGYAIGAWYRMALRIDGTRRLAKFWEDGAPEPDWGYATVENIASAPGGFPGLLAGSGTSGEAAFDDFVVLAAGR